MNKKIIDEMKNEAWLLKLKNVNTSTMEKPTDFVHYNDVRELCFVVCTKTVIKNFCGYMKESEKLLLNFSRLPFRQKELLSCSEKRMKKQFKRK